MSEGSVRVKSRLPVVAIVGRPNVGKSTLFNRFAGRRKAIILDTPGLTRDRNFERVEWRGLEFLAVDTGGYDPDPRSEMRTAILEQTNIAIEEADLVLFLVDVKDGIIPPDYEMTDILRRAKKPVILAVNKCDNQRLYDEAYAFSALGIDPLFPISALAGHGVGDLLDEIIDQLPWPEKSDDEEFAPFEEEEPTPRIAIVGRVNVGKSTLVNTILGERRMIASSEPGTTRDAVDSLVTYEERPYTIIDTAGIRRRGKIEESVEKLSVMRAAVSMQRADIAVILIDAAEGITQQDAHVAGQAVEAGCAAIIGVNKWDVVEKDYKTADIWIKRLRDEWGFLNYAPILFLSGLTGQRVQKIFQTVDNVLVEYRKRIDTGELNRWLQQTILRHSPPMRKGHTLKIKYITQVAVAPPTFAIFVNDPNLMHFGYERHLINQLRETYGFEGTPIRIRLRRKAEERR